MAGSEAATGPMDEALARPRARCRRSSDSWWQCRRWGCCGGASLLQLLSQLGVLWQSLLLSALALGFLACAVAEDFHRDSGVIPSLAYPPASQMWSVPLVSVGKLRRAVVNGRSVLQLLVPGL